jgi:CubicO group peptidase (beta-lactamase class C family)
MRANRTFYQRFQGNISGAYHRRLFTARILLLSLVSCGSGDNTRPPPSAPTAAVSSATPSASGAPSATSTKQLDADTPMKSASGASFEAPKGWFFTAKGDIITLDSPERDLTLTLVEVPNELDPQKAIHTAWKGVTSDFNRKATQTTSPPAKDGWDAITQVVYETRADEQRTVLALAQRKGTTQYVALLDGTNAGLDRRGAQLMTVISTFKAAGVVEESFKGRTAHSLDSARKKLLDQFIQDAMNRSKVLGSAIAIIQGGNVIYEKGFGLRELGKTETVTPNTLFMIGSTTKSLTSLMMAKLVDEGKFGWETPVSQVLPSFALADADMTRNVLMKHTVCACTGLPRQDLEFLFEYANVTPEQRIDAMKAMRPTTGFGETFQYSNTMVAAGGYVAAHALAPKKKLGPAYDDAMQTRVFGPLGMKSTTMDFAIVKSREHATPHAENVTLDSKKLLLSDEEGVVSVRPAGAAWSNVRDMAKYVMLELAKGRDEKGNPIVSDANLLKRRVPQIKITDKMAYGLGLFVENDHGIQVVHHGGNNMGFTSDMYFLPEHGVGVVMLTNAGDANAFRKAVRRRLFEVLFDGKDEAARSLDFALARHREAADKELKNITIDPELDWLKGFVGTYKNPNLGLIAIRVDGKVGTLDAGEWKSAFGKKREEDGTVKLILLDPPLAGLEFLPGVKDGQKSLTLDTPQHKYAFELQPQPTSASK